MSEPEHIEIAQVESSNLAGFGYSTASSTLAVEFKPRAGMLRGPVFYYRGVDVGLFDELLGAESKGSFYSRNIKGKFTAERMTGPCSNQVCREEGPIGESCVCCNEGTHRALAPRWRGEDRE